MARGWGLGPVFTYEMVTGARRWRVYAGRAIFVLLLLAGLQSIWWFNDRHFLGQWDMARVGREFLTLTTSIQMAVVLLIGPAAAAGSICVDKRRGTLTHVLVTDLSDREIVFGKLGARLAPVFALTACGVPVMALSGLFGGVDLEMVVGAYLVTIGAATLACSLAVCFSVWANKSHQALVATYAVLAAWVFFDPLLCWFLWWDVWNPRSPIHDIVTLSNPFGAVVASVYVPTSVGLMDQVRFLALTVVISVGLAYAAARSLRRIVLRQSARPARRETPTELARLMGYLPGPSLDGNPVLWREWHRKIPTRWTGRLWIAYAIVSGLASLWAIVYSYVRPDRYESLYLATQVNTWGVMIGLFLLSISAATSLAEERDRGSLDVILATPLATSAILWGKWWGTFAIVPRLAVFPFWVCAALAMVSEQWVGMIVMLGLLLSYSAMITSLGLALATWIPRLGRSVGVTVVSYLVVLLGPLVFLWVANNIRFRMGQPFFEPIWAKTFLLCSPYFGIARTTEWTGQLWVGIGRYGGPMAFYSGVAEPIEALLCIFFFAVMSFLLMLATLLTFDRCMGRVRTY